MGRVREVEELMDAILAGVALLMALVWMIWDAHHQRR
jgi:hypothetical protein